jgi:hypothetical protein
MLLYTFGNYIDEEEVKKGKVERNLKYRRQQAQLHYASENWATDRGLGSSLRYERTGGRMRRKTALTIGAEKGNILNFVLNRKDDADSHGKAV